MNEEDVFLEKQDPKRYSFGQYSQDLFRFLKSPRLSPIPRFTWLSLGRTLLYTLALDFVLVIVSLSLITSILGTEIEDQHKIRELFETSPLIVIILLTVFMGPALEEFAFRLFLRFSYLNVGISFSFLGFFLFASSPNFYVSLGIGLVFFSILSLFIRQALHPEKAPVILEAFWEKNIAYLFYASSFLFAFVHLSNYNLPPSTLALYGIILVFPQLVLGLILGYLRIRWGFGYALSFHMLHNALLVIPAVFLYPTAP